MYANYRTIPELIINRQSFEGNSVTGYYDGATYTVKSYNTIMLEIDGNGKIDFNNKYYSVTTSKLQNLIIRALELDIPCKRSL